MLYLWVLFSLVMYNYFLKLEGPSFIGFFQFSSAHRVWERDLFNNPEVLEALRSTFSIPAYSRVVQIGFKKFSISPIDNSKDVYRIESIRGSDPFENDEELKNDEEFAEQFGDIDFRLEQKRIDPHVWFLSISRRTSQLDGAIFEC